MKNIHIQKCHTQRILQLKPRARIEGIFVHIKLNPITPNAHWQTQLIHTRYQFPFLPNNLYGCMKRCALLDGNLFTTTQFSRTRLTVQNVNDHRVPGYLAGLLYPFSTLRPPYPMHTGLSGPIDCPKSVCRMAERGSTLNETYAWFYLFRNLFF